MQRVAYDAIVQTVEFQIDPFRPFLPMTIEELLRLIDEAESTESKRRILGTLNVVMERAETHVCHSSYFSGFIPDSCVIDCSSVAYGGVTSPSVV